MAPLAFVAFIVRSLAVGQIAWPIVCQFLAARTILYGIDYTVLMAVVAMFVGISLGLLFTVMRMSQNLVTRGIAILYLWIFRVYWVVVTPMRGATKKNVHDTGFLDATSMQFSPEDAYVTK